MLYGFWQFESSGLAYKGAELESDKYPMTAVSHTDHEPVAERR